MTKRNLVLLPLLALAGTALSGCVAVAIPALAGSALAGREIVGPGDEDDAARQAPSPAPAPAPVAAPAPPRAPAPVASAPAAASPASAPAPAVVAAAPAPQPAAAENTPATDTTRTTGFARLVRYGRAVSLSRGPETGMLSAMLSDPYALDGQRRRCAPGVQPVVLIDLDPAGGVFAVPATPARRQSTILGFAVLREARVVIAWISDLPVEQSGALRDALAQSGLDPRGEDIISLRRDEDKQTRRESLAATSCIIAIGGDERPDFDDRFRYLKTPEAGALLEPIIGDGWFFTDPLLTAEGDTAP
ncbi:hypothetical protein [Porphyrobacter sp. CACIAM 03H1]|uniref:hypothetical protein n=1 Tax=Porphyrobacter sp. CACIAM 03H1 TaxID=2003315 RepID=UPI000B5A6382|nr:hypothetical protein [Porphyrobacter sp. CACIAM 03H1]ASJ89716.1 hypothetical protein CBR61_01355 [Porphyrobacter sp. CACIAM 03H1]